MKNKFVFIINSAISIPNKPLCYASISSIFTPYQRLQQTNKTIDSIKKRFSSAKIILIENSKDKDLLKQIANKVDEYYNVNDHLLARLATNSKWKGLSEVIAMLLARKFLTNKGIFFFKICGRYYLNNQFTISDWDLEKFNFLEKDGVFSTRLYGFPQKLFNQWQLALIKTIPSLMFNKSLELVLKNALHGKRINYLKKLGLAGNIAPTGEFINE